MNDQNLKICECDCDECQDYGCNCNCSCTFERPKKYLKPNRTMLKCGSISSVTLPAATTAGSSFTLATVNVDTKNLKSPCIKFEFASNIVTTAATLTLNLRVFKQCKGQLNPIPIGSVWTFARLTAVTDSNTFSFFVCDCDICDDECCTYSVVATVAGANTTGVTAINNASLSAIIVDNDCSF